MNRYFTKALMVVIISIFGVFSVFTEEIYFEEGGFFMDFPENWALASMDHPRFVTFTDVSQAAIAQILILKDKPGLNEFFLEISEALGVKAEYDNFTYDGRDALLGTHKISLDNAQGSGWVFASYQKGYSIYIVTYATQELSTSFQDDFLSIINSFSFDLGGLAQPGPVSQYYIASDNSSATSETLELDFGSSTIELENNRTKNEALQITIEREARLLYNLGAVQESVFITAWNRYYRTIFRETKALISAIMPELRFNLMDQRIERDQWPQFVLSWLQGFEYYRSEGFSDFLSAGTCLSSQKGDCDSLGLIYIAIMQELGFDSILFVSPYYGHAVAGIALDIPGASMEYNGTRYVVAELTAQVDIGLIAEDVSNIEKWIAMDIRPASTMLIE